MKGETSKSVARFFGHCAFVIFLVCFLTVAVAIANKYFAADIPTVPTQSADTHVVQPEVKVYATPEVFREPKTTIVASSDTFQSHSIVSESSVIVVQGKHGSSILIGGANSDFYTQSQFMVGVQEPDVNQSDNGSFTIGEDVSNVIQSGNGILMVGGDAQTVLQLANGKVTIQGDVITVSQSGAGQITIEGDVNIVSQSGNGHITIQGDVANISQSGNGSINVQGDTSSIIQNAAGTVTVEGDVSQIRKTGNGNVFVRGK